MRHDHHTQRVRKTGSGPHRVGHDGGGSGETTLTGTTLAKAKAAVLAKYPGGYVRPGRD